MTSIEMSTEVVIIGGGPSGLALALDLALRDIDVTIVDRGLEPLPGVRAGGISHQMMENMRRLGVAEELRELAPLPVDWPRTSVVTARLADREITILAPRLNRQQSAHLTAEPPQNAPSALMEKIVRKRLAELPNAHRLFGYEFDGDLENSESGVVVKVRDESGAITRISARFAAGSDGARSQVREAVGIGIDGKPAFATRWKMQFTSSAFRDIMGKGKHNQYWVINRDMVAYFLQRDAVKEWTLHIQEATEEFQALFTDPAALIERIVGKPVPLDSVEEKPRRWRANAFWAERLREKSVFLLGDAAHAMPPGGFGLHLGNGDAANLAWKLQAVLQGWGGPALIESYNAERFPLARSYAQAVEVTAHPVRAAVLGEPAYETGGPGDEEARERVAQVAIASRAERQNRMLESIYDTVASSILPAVGDTAKGLVVVGRRLPHRWLSPDNSIYDEVDGPFVLFAEGARTDDTAAAARAAKTSGIPLKVVTIPEGLFEKPLVLVRPDRVVAWLGDRLHDPQFILSIAVGMVEEFAAARSA